MDINLNGIRDRAIQDVADASDAEAAQLIYDVFHHAAVAQATAYSIAHDLQSSKVYEAVIAASRRVEQAVVARKAYLAQNAT